MSKELNAVLQSVVDRNEAQKQERIARMRAELVDLGYSIVTTEWLNAVFANMKPHEIDRVTGGARK
jgi:hypothetical protein